MKWVRCLSSTTVLVGDLLMVPGCSSTVPSAPASMTVWNIRPTFSSRERRPSEVLDPLLDGQPWVLVGVHPAVAVEVAVGDAVLGRAEARGARVGPFVGEGLVAARCVGRAATRS